MSLWDELLQEAKPPGHFVQLYESDEYLLAKNVSDYIRDGFEREDRFLIIATREHNEQFARRLWAEGIQMEAAMRSGRLVALDADELLDRSMVSGRLDWGRFDRVVGTVVRQAAAARAGLRAYSEMVGVLWKAGRFSSAIRLERFWNKLLASQPFSLFCAYPINVFGKEFRIRVLDALLCAHTHLLPSGTIANLENAINRAMDEVLGPRVDDLRLLIKANYRPSWAVLPKAEAIVLWLRNNLPEDADEILSRALKYYQPSRPSAIAFASQKD